MDSVQEFDLTGPLSTMVPLVSTWGMRVLGALLVFFIGRMMAGALRRWSTRALRRSPLDETLVPFIASLAYYMALTFVVIAVLGILTSKNPGLTSANGT